MSRLHDGPIAPVLSPGLSGRLRLALVGASPIAVAPSAEPLDAEMERLRATLAAEHAGRQPSEIPGLAPARELYRTFGIDPTRTRPSSEALLRRVIQGKPLPRILNAVDVCNLCSLSFLLPIGLYDAGKIRGSVALRQGGPGESYEGIRKDSVHLEGRLALADEEGPFGNPSSDSLRTSVSAATVSLWMVVFAPGGYDRRLLESHLEFARGAIERHLAPAGALVVTRGEILG